MMRRLGISLEVTCATSDVLGKLIENREHHAEMVKEARKGYVEQARVALEKKLGQIVEGKIVALTFSLSPPRDYTAVYDTAISMLQRHTEHTVQLGADEYRHLVDDTWDWTDDFIGVNSSYSISTRAYAASKGFE